MTANPDPVEQLIAMADRIARRVPPQMTRGEVWAYVAVMMRVASERVDWLDGLPPDDRALFFDCLYAPLLAFRSTRVQ